MLIREYAELSLIYSMVSVEVTLQFLLGDAMDKILFYLSRVISLSRRLYHPIWVLGDYKYLVALPYKSEFISAWSLKKV